MPREDYVMERRDPLNARLEALREQADAYKSAGEKMPDHLAGLLKSAEKAFSTFRAETRAKKAESKPVEEPVKAEAPPEPPKTEPAPVPPRVETPKVELPKAEPASPVLPVIQSKPVEPAKPVPAPEPPVVSNEGVKATVKKAEPVKFTKPSLK